MAAQQSRRFIPADVTTRFGSDKMATLRIPAPIYHALKLAAMVAVPSDSLNRWLAKVVATAAADQLAEFAAGPEANQAAAVEALERAQVCRSFADYLSHPQPSSTE